MRVRRGLAILLTAAALLAAAPPPAPPPAILDASAVPYLDAAGRADYRRFAEADLPRAFAIAPDGHHAFATQRGSDADTAERALEYCAIAGGAGCALYARDLDIVWPAKPWHAGAAPAQLDGGAVLPDPDYLWHGPGAPGIVIWMQSAAERPEYLRLLNNAGMDIAHLPDGAPPALEALHRDYRRVVVAGDGAGAWAALHVPGADAVIAVSPAGAGTLAPPADDPPDLRLAYVQFADDPMIPDPDARVGVLRARIHPPARLLLLDRPEGFGGHDAGLYLSFSRSFGACLTRFVLSDHPPSGC